MSYCRFSTNDFKCDVYVYSSEEGWVTHVAANRVVPIEPLPPPEPLAEENVGVFLQRYAEVSKIIGCSPRVKIEHPDAGKTFIDPSPGDCAKTLRRLRDSGFVVPEGVIECLEEEQAELDQEAGQP